MTEIIVGTLDELKEEDFTHRYEYLDFCKMRDERLLLLKAIENEDFDVTEVPIAWPRDIFNVHNGKVIDIFTYGPRFAEGGNVIPTKNVIIASNHINKGEGGEETSISGIRSIYNLEPFFFPPAMEKMKEKHNEHIDPAILPFDQLGILYIDKAYREHNKRKVSEFAERNYFSEIISVGDNYSGPREWPCNSLILEKPSGDLVVFTNKGKKGSYIKGDLSRKGIKTIEVPFMNNTFEGGSVRCATNYLPDSCKSSDIFKSHYEKGFLESILIFKSYYERQFFNSLSY